MAHCMIEVGFVYLFVLFIFFCDVRFRYLRDCNISTCEIAQKPATKARVNLKRKLNDKEWDKFSMNVQMADIFALFACRKCIFFATGIGIL